MTFSTDGRAVSATVIQHRPPSAPRGVVAPRPISTTAATAALVVLPPPASSPATGSSSNSAADRIHANVSRFRKTYQRMETHEFLCDDSFVLIVSPARLYAVDFETIEELGFLVCIGGGGGGQAATGVGLPSAPPTHRDSRSAAASPVGSTGGSYGVRLPALQQPGVGSPGSPTVVTVPPDTRGAVDHLSLNDVEGVAIDPDTPSVVRIQLAPRPEQPSVSRIPYPAAVPHARPLLSVRLASSDVAADLATAVHVYTRPFRELRGQQVSAPAGDWPAHLDPATAGSPGTQHSGTNVDTRSNRSGLPPRSEDMATTNPNVWGLKQNAKMLHDVLLGGTDRKLKIHFTGKHAPTKVENYQPLFDAFSTASETSGKASGRRVVLDFKNVSALTSRTLRELSNAIREAGMLLTAVKIHSCENFGLEGMRWLCETASTTPSLSAVQVIGECGCEVSGAPARGDAVHLPTDLSRPFDIAAATADQLYDRARRMAERNTASGILR